MSELDEASWRPVPGFDGYEASEDGRIRSIPREWHTGIGLRRHGYLTMSCSMDISTGYVRAKVRSSGRSRSVYLHRLIALAWIPNPEGKPHINHINGDKLDCRAANLDWCTPRENNLHALAAGLNTGAGQFGKRCATTSNGAKQ